MHSFIIFRAAVFALLAGSAFGESGFWSMLRLFKRQSQAFQPSTDLTPTCDANQLQCGPEPTPTCYTPSLGDVCCSGGYACPGGSFCLTAGFCCPNGLSPESCAQQFSVTLPPGFNTNPQSASATSPPSSPPTSSPVTTSTTVTAGKNVTFTATPTTQSASQFTGAASHQKTIGGIAAVLLGIAGLVGHAL